MGTGATITKELPVEGVCRSLGVNPEAGLTEREARRRRRRFGPNAIYDERRASILGYVADSAFDLLFLLLLLTAVTAAIFRQRTAYAVVIPILFVNIILRTAAYIRAKRQLEACPTRREFMPDAAVRRDGGQRRIDARDVVIGDIICLSQGGIVPADCRLISSRGLFVFEEQITGVKGAVSKDAGSDGGASSISRANTVYAGSSVTSGEGAAVVTHTGADTLVVRTKGYFRPTRGEKLRLSSRLEMYGRRWGAIMTLLAFFVTVLDLLVGGGGLYEVFFLGLSLAASSMCELYSAIGDITAANGIASLRKRAGVAVRGVRSIETLSGLDVIITHTDGVISVGGVEAGAYFFDGEVKDAAKDGETVALPGELIRYAAIVTTTAEGEEAHTYSDAASALRDYITYTDADKDKLYGDGEAPILLSGPGAGLLFDTRLLRGGDGGFLSVSCGGAAELVPACAFVRAHGEDSALTDRVREGIVNFIAYHERKGGIAVAVARKKTPFSSPERMMFTQSDMTLFGIIILYRPLAHRAVETAESFRRAGVRVVLTGGGSETAKLADRVGIISGKGDILTGRGFAAMTESQREQAAKTARLLIGFGAQEKLLYAAAVRKTGAKAAYIASSKGDMMGELSMLGAVGAGFAMQDAPVTLKMRADAILPVAEQDGSDEGNTAPGGITAVAAAVAYSKRIYRNISNIARYLLTSQAARIFAVILCVIFGSRAITSEQVLIWGMIFDFFAMLLLARELPEQGALSDHVDVSEKMLLPSAIFGLLWAIVTIAAPVLSRNESAMTPSVIFVSVLLSLVVVCGEYRSSHPVFSRKRRVSPAPLLFAAAAAAVIVAVTVFPWAASSLGLTQPDERALLTSVIPAAVMLAVFEACRALLTMDKEKNEQ